MHAGVFLHVNVCVLAYNATYTRIYFICVNFLFQIMFITLANTTLSLLYK